MKFAHFSHVWNRPGMTPGQRYDQLWRELAVADEAGLDYGFAVEHHFEPHESWNTSPAIYTMGAGMHTHRLRVGPMGYIAPLHNPLRMVEEVAMLDQALGGRLEVGLVSGIVPTFFQPYGVDYQNRRAMTQEALELLKVAFENGGQFDFQGRFYNYRNVRLSVLPVQKPRPPLWLETRDRQTLEILAREGVDTGYFILLPRADAAAAYRPYIENWQRAGWDRKPRISYLTLVYVDESDEIALQRALPHALAAWARFFRADINPGRLREQAEFFRARGEHGGADIIANILNPEYLLRKDLVFIGSPQTVADKLRSAATEGLFNVALCEFNFGSLPEELIMDSMRLFAAEVAPKLRDFEPF